MLTIVQVRAYVKALSVYQADLERLSDEASIASLEDTRARLEDMLVAMGCDKSGKTITSTCLCHISSRIPAVWAARAGEQRGQCEGLGREGEAPGRSSTTLGHAGIGLRRTGYHSSRDPEGDRFRMGKRQFKTFIFR